MIALGIHGLGVVSPAGWGLDAFRQALANGAGITPQALARPGWSCPLQVRRVPAPATKPAFLANPRLRRTSPISQYAVAAALEAIGSDVERVRSGQIRLGIIFCVMSGCVNYSRRFYDETLKDPSTASPLVFPETVFNAPASHLGSLLGTTAVNYTLVGDPGSFLQALALAGDWLEQGRTDACVVVAAEECDWLTADAFRLFTRQIIVADGAAAIYLRPGPGPGGCVVSCVSDALLFTDRTERCVAIAQAAREAQEQYSRAEENVLLCDGLQGADWLDAPEARAWSQWTGPRISPRRVLGEGLMASAAWQCVAAADALERGVARRAVVHISGINEHVMWAGLERV